MIPISGILAASEVSKKLASSDFVVRAIDKQNQNRKKAVMWEGVAEEAVELAHVAQKIARIMRGENPVAPGTNISDLIKKAIEEFNDLLIYTDVLDVKFDPEQYGKKLERASNRGFNLFDKEDM